MLFLRLYAVFIVHRRSGVSGIVYTLRCKYFSEIFRDFAQRIIQGLTFIMHSLLDGGEVLLGPPHASATLLLQGFYTATVGQKRRRTTTIIPKPLGVADVPHVVVKTV